MAINFSSNREPKDHIFILGFLHMDGNVGIFNVQAADAGSSVRSEGMSLCTCYSRTAPPHNPTCHLSHLGNFLSFNMYVRKMQVAQTSVPGSASSSA